MSYNNAISSSDPQAIEKLTEKLEACQKIAEAYERGQRILPQTWKL
jgi:hypothetical protein